MTSDRVCPGMRVLEGRYMIPLLVYILGHDGCMKTDIYRDVGRGTRMPDKLDLLEASGFLSREELVTGRTVMHLTDRGAEVARRLADIEAYLAGTLN